MSRLDSPVHLAKVYRADCLLYAVCLGACMTLPDTREKLLCAAGDAFAEQGYRCGVDEIARRAGVAKQTLYHHFSGKDELFAEVIQRMAGEILVALGPVGERPVRESLLRFALAYRSKALGQDGLAMHRVLVAEAPRLPELVHRVFIAGTGETARRLQALLAHGMASGQLRQDDPLFAADMLLSMLAGMERSRRLMASAQPDDDAPERVAQIVDCFLRAFAPAPIPQ